MWDDFVFLEIAQTFRLSYLLPPPESIFYRPLAREVYFGLLNALHPLGIVVAHCLNAALLIAAIVLLISWGTRLGGRKVGISSGLVFAGMGFVPMLVGWITTVQDLLAVVFCLVALRLEHDGRSALAALAFAGAALSKESALFLAPVLILYPWILGFRPLRIWRNAVGYGIVVAAWAAIHPGLRLLGARGFRGEGASYLGIDDAGKLEFLWKSAFTLLNVPPEGLGTPWPDGRTLVLALAGIVALVLVWKTAGWKRDSRAGTTAPGAPETPTTPRVILLLGLLALLPTILTAAVVRFWSPLYSALPAIGSSVLLATGLSRLQARVAGTAVAALLVLGVWSRGLEDAPLMMHEENLRRTAGALTQVERGFKRLHPTLPPKSHVYLAAFRTGSEGVSHHLFDLKALRVWYSDPTIATLRPTDRKPEPGPEFLIWVSTNLDVVEVDLETLEPRSSGEKPAYPDFQRTIRQYAMGLAGAGEADRAVAIMLGIPKMVQQDAMLDYRIAALALIADGRMAEARPILGQVPTFRREGAIGLIGTMLAQPVRGRDLEDPAFAAFGFNADDIDARRDLMRWMGARRFYAAAARVATRVLAARPGDPEAKEMLDKAARAARPERWFGGGPRDAL